MQNAKVKMQNAKLSCRMLKAGRVFLAFCILHFAFCILNYTALIAIVVWTVTARTTTNAQVRPIYDSGTAGLVHLLGRLQTTASVLHTGAHPDDEDSAFIARMARGDHARVGYLSLTRGEGGQNIIGPELFDALGVIRTEELLQARRLDGGEQFFSRAFDYGFSKTLTEAKTKWNEREVLGDMVRVIRMFRPLVIYSRFAGTEADGHGQHQFAGYLTPLAFKAAGDPKEYPEQIAEGLRPWQPRKLYRGGGRADLPATVQVQTGILDPVIGRTYAAVAAEGRSQHKSQQMGGIEPLGPSASGLRLIDSLVPVVTTETSVFDGVDTSLRGLPALMGLPPTTLAAELTAIETAAREALSDFRALEPERILPALARGLRATRSARRALQSASGSAEARADTDFVLASKETDFVEALSDAAGIVVDPLSDEETLVPGGSVDVNVRVFLERPALVRVTDVTIITPTGWRDERVAPPEPSGDFRRELPTELVRFRVTAPLEALPTQPYFLARPRRGDLYDWTGEASRGLPFGSPLLAANVTLEVDGTAFMVSTPVRYRFADGVRGELRRDLGVVPELSVGLDSTLLVVSTSGSPRPRRIVVTATRQVSRPMSGTLRLALPPGWTSAPASAPFSVSSAGESASAAFTVSPPARRTPGTVVIRAEAAASDGRVFSQAMEVVAYPHIQSHRIYAPAAARVELIDLAVAPVRVGYIMGSGDDVPAALERMGIDVTMIDPDLLTTGDLSRFDTIVVGVRASEARPDFAANQSRLRAFMERGGTLVVQYQQRDYVERRLPPFPVESPGNSRVTDETSPVRILSATHPVFTFPNRITTADFNDWVQERNLYAFGTFDARYLPLLESADPGETPQRGGEVIAQVGKGHYIYTAYSWFRQLPAGVPGAYRQFANLISLPKAP
jgi:LmbE family N-acetylglucosaminyl deacetylase